MATKMIDLTGQRFGRLQVIEFDHMEKHGKHKRPFWKCLCDCGNTKIVGSNSLRTGSTRSCGCLRKELARDNHYLGNPYRQKLYGILRMVKKRCTDKEYEHYKNYGGRGITLCEEWSGEEGFDNFVKWSMESGYKEGLTLDRIDNDKGYSSDNCQWATRKHQSNNKRNNIWITLNGETKTLMEWCEYYNVPYGRVEARFSKMGWTIEDALFTPRYQKPKGDYSNGKCSNNSEAEENRHCDISCQ